MSTKLAEYLLQQDKANKLKQDAIDEAVTNLVSSIENTFKAAEQVKAIAPDYEFSKLSKLRKLAAKFGLTDTPDEAQSSKGKSKGAKGKTAFKLSDEKAKEILDFIGSGEKSTKEIAKHLGTKNASNAITYLKEQGKIILSRKDGLKKFWKRA
jgi:hypothetical protein